MGSWSSSSNPKLPLYWCFLILCALIINMPRATALYFNITSFHDHGGDIVLQGDAYISSNDGHVELTTNSIDKSPLNSSGRAMYKSLLPLWDSASGEAADFSTHFKFTINSLNDTHHADGLAFFLAAPAALPDIDQAKGGGMGILRDDQIPDSDPFRFLAVEFDTFPNSFDPGYEHVGIDVNSLQSSTHVAWCNSVLQGKENEVWISYDSVAHNLSVALTGYCNGSDTKFRQYLDYEVDLASFLPENVAFGFAAATGIVSELHTIKLWYFNSSLILVPNPEPPPSSEPPVPVPSPRPHHVNIVFLVELSVGIVTFLGLIGIIVWLLVLPRTRNGNTEDVGDDQKGDGTQIDVTDQFYTTTEHDSRVTAEQESDPPLSIGRPREEEGELKELKNGEMDEAGPSNKDMDEVGPSNRYGSDSLSMDEELESCTGPKKYSYDELARATNDFDPQEKLGGGAFGSVYRGALGALEIAVKVSKGSEQEAKQYAAEVRIISQVRHKNLVELFGWCHEEDKLLLVYEFVPKGSLDYHIFDTHELLPFKARYNIVVGLADALSYLHQGLKQCVVHRDIKSSNILLNESLEAKLGDFGLARQVGHDKWQYTTDFAGTVGYLAPECFVTGKASKQADVYSFGVVVLEIACGRRATWYPNGEQSNHKGLVHWVWELYGTKKLLNAVDTKLGGAFDKEKMTRLLMTGLLCANPLWESRLTMNQALQYLKDEPLKKLPHLPSKMPTPTN